jgi:DNA gyrase subunit A
MGVVFTRFDDSDRILAIAKNSERNLVSEDGDEETPASQDAGMPAGPEGSSVEETTEADPPEDVND